MRILSAVFVPDVGLGVVIAPQAEAFAGLETRSTGWVRGLGALGPHLRSVGESPVIQGRPKAFPGRGKRRRRQLHLTQRLRALQLVGEVAEPHGIAAALECRRPLDVILNHLDSGAR